MISWEELLKILETTIKTPEAYGVFHLAWLAVAAGIIIVLFFLRKRNNDKQLKSILSVYGITAFMLEALKQIIWSVDYNKVTKVFEWEYQWYAFPFQLCTMPIYITLICLLLKKGWLRDALLSFVAYVTILGSIASIVMPDSLFVPELLVNVHAMWLHVGSFVVSVYLLMSKEVPASRKHFFSAIGVFLACVILASILNVAIYNSGILKGETFNMFYISPYFESSLPVFNEIYNKVPYFEFLAIYIGSVILGSWIIYRIMRLITGTKRNIIKFKNNVQSKLT